MADNVLVQKLNTFFGEKVLVFFKILIILSDMMIEEVKATLRISFGNEMSQ